MTQDEILNSVSFILDRVGNQHVRRFWTWIDETDEKVTVEDISGGVIVEMSQVGSEWRLVGYKIRGLDALIWTQENQRPVRSIPNIPTDEQISRAFNER